MIRTSLDRAMTAALQGWAAETESWPAGSHVWGQYAEQTACGPVICRTETASACHAPLRRLVDGELREVAAAVLGEDAVAFKDKLNYKHPGGAGFSPHQDLLAYPGVARVVSILVAIDECRVDSGCLWMADGVDRALPVDERGVVRAEVADALHWDAVELGPGEAVCIDGLAPHYSEANRSQASRRVLVASYAPSAERYTRERYYSARHASMSETKGFRISTLADFDGTEAPAVVVAADGCVH